MLKTTTVHLHQSLDAQLSAEAAATGTSRSSDLTIPVLRSGRSRTMDEIDDAIYESIKERASRR